MKNKKTLDRTKRHARVRAKMHGTAARPRLVVYRSLSHVYAQLVDDDANKVITAVSDMKIKTKGAKIDQAKAVGTEIATIAKDKKITAVVFDRNGYKYHGRVKSVADGAREGGLKF